MRKCQDLDKAKGELFLAVGKPMIKVEDDPGHSELVRRNLRQLLADVGPTSFPKMRDCTSLRGLVNWLSTRPGFGVRLSPPQKAAIREMVLRRVCISPDFTIKAFAPASKQFATKRSSSMQVSMTTGVANQSGAVRIRHRTSRQVVLGKPWSIRMTS